MPTTQIPDDPEPDAGDLPLPLSASLILTTLPKDAAEALKGVVDSTLGIPEKGVYFLF